MQNENFPHDPAYKAMFGFPETVKSLLLDFVPENFVRHFDFTTLKPSKASYVTPEYRLLHDDVVWGVRWKNRESYIVIILELQSYEQYIMSARITAYSGCFWLDWTKSNNLKTGGKLPPVFPIVLYNGDKPWNAPTNTLDLVDIPHEALVPYQPNQKYVVVDAKRVPQEILAKAQGDAAYIIRGEQANTPNKVIEIGTEFISSKTSEDNPDLRKTLVDWLDMRILKIEPEWASKNAKEKSGMLAELLREVEKVENKCKAQAQADLLKEIEKVENRYKAQAQADLLKEVEKVENKCKAQAQADLLKEVEKVENRYKAREKEVFEEGETRGEAKGKAEVISCQRTGLLEMLSVRFGEIPADWRNALSNLNDPEKISALTISILKVKSPEEYGKLLMAAVTPQ